MLETDVGEVFERHPCSTEDISPANVALTDCSHEMQAEMSAEVALL